MYLKPTIQNATNFGYFAEFDTVKKKFLLLFYLYILSHNFILSGCGMAGEICGGKKNTKNLSLGCPVLSRCAV
jgi:hypothetical protein